LNNYHNLLFIKSRFSLGVQKYYTELGCHYTFKYTGCGYKFYRFYGNLVYYLQPTKVLLSQASIVMEPVCFIRICNTKEICMKGTKVYNHLTEHLADMNSNLQWSPEYFLQATHNDCCMSKESSDSRIIVYDDRSMLEHSSCLCMILDELYKQSCMDDNYSNEIMMHHSKIRFYTTSTKYSFQK